MSLFKSTPSWVGRSAAVGLAVAALSLSPIAPAAQATNVPTAVPPLSFSVSDGTSPEGFRFVDPSCTPGIVCRPELVAGKITFQVSINALPAGQPVTVRYTTVNGTATTPIDYSARSGTLTFQPGATSRQVTVPLNFMQGGTEPTETFTLRLSQPSIAGDTSDIGVGTIIDGIVDID